MTSSLALLLAVAVFQDIAQTCPDPEPERPAITPREVLQNWKLSCHGGPVRISCRLIQYDDISGTFTRNCGTLRIGRDGWCSVRFRPLTAATSKSAINAKGNRQEYRPGRRNTPWFANIFWTPCGLYSVNQKRKTWQYREIESGVRFLSRENVFPFVPARFPTDLVAASDLYVINAHEHTVDLVVLSPGSLPFSESQALRSIAFHRAQLRFNRNTGQLIAVRIFSARGATVLVFDEVEPLESFLEQPNLNGLLSAEDVRARQRARQAATTR